MTELETLLISALEKSQQQQSEQYEQLLEALQQYETAYSEGQRRWQEQVQALEDERKRSVMLSEQVRSLSEQVSGLAEQVESLSAALPL